MKGDFSRNTFDPLRHYSRVLMQQGRVQLDADWNEQTEILLHYLRTLACDIIGPHAGPLGALGFDILTGDTADADNRIDEAEQNDPERAKLLKDAIHEQNNAVIMPGRYYVDGILVENERPILYTEQPGYPFDPTTTIEALQHYDGTFLAYLDVWERHITNLEDDHIREVSLGGPDTCTRAKVVWQVKVLIPQGDVNEPSCDAVEELLGIGTGRLRAQSRLDRPQTELCVIAPESRYRGAENQLYRVEVHRGGTAGGTNGATFKWSRENGSVTFPIRRLSGNSVTLEHLGRDKHLGLMQGDWVEVVDEGIAMRDHAGTLARIETVDHDMFSVTVKFPDDVSDPPSYTDDDVEAMRPLLRRWDHVGDPGEYSGALPIRENSETHQDWLELEDGIEIRFEESGVYRAGDYWTVPARTATGDVYWPHEVDALGKPLLDSDEKPIAAARPAEGIRHCYAPLFLDRQEEDRRDCRCPIASMPCVEEP
jgi:hypothetical protein